MNVLLYYYYCSHNQKSTYFWKVQKSYDDMTEFPVGVLYSRPSK